MNIVLIMVIECRKHIKKILLGGIMMAILFGSVGMLRLNIAASKPSYNATNYDIQARMITDYMSEAEEYRDKYAEAQKNNDVNLEKYYNQKLNVTMKKKIDCIDQYMIYISPTSNIYDGIVIGSQEYYIQETVHFVSGAAVGAILLTAFFGGKGIVNRGGKNKCIS